MGAAENVKVVCRIRPLNQKENKRGEKQVVDILNSQQIKIKGKEKRFNFDAVLGPESSQQDVYNKGAKFVVDDVLKGYNGTIFAYGQTSSGKTYTMEGELRSKEKKGIIPRIITDIFKVTDKMKNIDLTIKVAYFEIYNEKVSDLLDKTRTNLAISEDKKGTPYVKNLTEENVKNSVDIMRLINKGKKNRHTAGTNMNEHSSRSHSVFQMHVQQDNRDSHKKTAGKLFLVDLAGSEKVSKSGAQGETLTEAKNINKSLSCLGNVIAALTESNRAHVPYRDSKLTRILQQSLGGNSRTTVIICASPAAYNEAETVSTLRFGIRAKTIKNVVKANVEVSAAEWRNRFNKINKHMTTVKGLVLKLVKETRKWRDGKKPDKKEQIDLDALVKMLEKGIDLKAKIDAVDGDDDDDDANERRDKERLKDKLSRTSIAIKKKTKKPKSAASGKTATNKKTKTKGSKENLSVVSEADEGSTTDEEGESVDVPEDVLAVLREEVELKTKQMKEERGKLQKTCDEKDDEIADLEQAKSQLEEKIRCSEKLIRDAQNDSKRAKEAIKMAQNEIMHYKERNRRLETAAQEAREETEKEKDGVLKKTEEIQRKIEELRKAREEAVKAEQAADEARREIEAQRKKFGEQLARLADDVGDIGRAVTGDPKNAGDFDVKVDLDKPEETLAALRVLLTKAKHNAEQAKSALKENQNDKNDNEKKSVEQMVLLNQAREKIAKLQHELDAAQKTIKDLQDKMNDRNAKIAQMAKDGTGESVDPDLDPDLQMLRDEQQRQLRELRDELDKLRKEKEELEKQKDEWQVEAEGSKQADLVSSDGESEEDGGPTTIDADQENLKVPSEPGKTSEAEIQTLDQIKKDMSQALAKNKAPGSDTGGGSKSLSPPKKPGEDDSDEEFPAGSMGQKQIAFLESTLDSVTKNNRALAAENRTLKVQRLPALQAMVKSLQARCQELERLLKAEREKNKSKS